MTNVNIQGSACQLLISLVTRRRSDAPPASGLIELEIAVATLRLSGNVQEESLRAVLRVLRESA